MIALLDANLFVPTWIIDPLLSLAEAGLCEPAWSARVMDEARLAIMEVRHVPDVRARGFLDAICRAFPMAMAEDWERFEPDVNLSDPNDGHVVAAARRAGAETIVYGQINVYGVTTKSERHKRSYWTRTADGNGIGGRKAPVPYGS